MHIPGDVFSAGLGSSIFNTAKQHESSAAEKTVSLLKKSVVADRGGVAALKSLSEGDPFRDEVMGEGRLRLMSIESGTVSMSPKDKQA